MLNILSTRTIKNSALANVSVSDGVSPSPKGGGRRLGPPLSPPLFWIHISYSNNWNGTTRAIAVCVQRMTVNPPHPTPHIFSAFHSSPTRNLRKGCGVDGPSSSLPPLFPSPNNFSLVPSIFKPFLQSLSFTLYTLGAPNITHSTGI